MKTSYNLTSYQKQQCDKFFSVIHPGDFIYPGHLKSRLGECKNYASTLGVTYVGKFYSLLVSTGVSFGIIFTQKGLTGNEEEFHDAYGLTKVLRIIEKYQNNRDMFILTFTLEDYEKIANGESFFNLIKAKKLALHLSSGYDSFLKDYQHDNIDSIKRIIQSI